MNMHLSDGSFDKIWLPKLADLLIKFSDKMTGDFGASYYIKRIIDLDNLLIEKLYSLNVFNYIDAKNMLIEIFIDLAKQDTHPIGHDKIYNRLYKLNPELAEEFSNKFKLSNNLSLQAQFEDALVKMSVNRYKREVIQMESDFVKLKKYVDLPYHYIHFTNDSKLHGLNIKTQFNTPIGFYGYPLTQDRYDKLLKNDIEFAGERPEIIVFKFKDPSSVLDFGNYTDDDLNNDVQKLKTAFPESSDRIEELHQESPSKAVKSHPGSQLFYITITMSSNSFNKKEEKKYKESNDWVSTPLEEYKF